MSGNHLTGHVAIVTGANHCNSAAAARTLGCRGASVLVAFWPIPDHVREHVRQRRDLIHIARPEEVADLVTFLVSDETKLITGNRIHLR